MRVWYLLDTWHISTHKKLDAFESRWGSRQSYGDLFKTAVISYFKNDNNISDEDIYLNFLNSLDKSLVYTFIIRSTINNRLVCNPVQGEQKIYFSGEFKIENNDAVLLSTNSSNISKPTEKLLDLSFNNMDTMIESLCSYAKGLDPKVSPGVLLYYNEGMPVWGTLKIVNSNYHQQELLRDNCPNVIIRYIQLRNDPLLNSFKQLYPEHNHEFVIIERILKNIVNNIFHAYKTRYYRLKYIRIPPEQYYIMNAVHTMNPFDPRKSNINTCISKNVFMDYINAMPSNRVNHLIMMEFNRGSQEVTR